MSQDALYCMHHRVALLSLLPIASCHARTHALACLFKSGLLYLSHVRFSSQASGFLPVSQGANACPLVLPAHTAQELKAVL